MPGLIIDCAGCTNPTPPAPALPPTALPPLYKVGHIATIFESIATPVEHLFLNYEHYLNPTAVKRCKDALDGISAPDSPVGKYRPCVLTSPLVSGEKGADCMLLATINYTPYGDLPRVYRWFLVGIYPNKSHPLLPHLHTVPEWRNPSQWVMAYSFRSTRSLVGLWPRARDPNYGPNREVLALNPPANVVGTDPVYTMRDDDLGLLFEIAGQKLLDWGQECEDNQKFAPECEEGYRVRLLLT